uniref:Uncharacterized protein n=1 Tax=Arundo donax TaxID=35708 RepID=A0A0A9BTK6_ARUDO
MSIFTYIFHDCGPRSLSLIYFVLIFHAWQPHLEC